jgi:hypothetical protein
MIRQTAPGLGVGSRVLDSSLMNDLPVDLGLLRERVRELRTELRDEVSSTAGKARPSDDDGGLVCDALLQLFDLLERSGAASDSGEMTALGEYGMHLLEELGAMARRAAATSGVGSEQLCLPFALWIARHGGELRNLAPVVNGLAFRANQQSRPEIMAGLYACCCELIDAASPGQQEGIGDRPGHPFRLLLLNRAIIATRSHNADFIAAAFDAVIEQIPDEGPAFFAEAMEQIAVVDYPDHVRDLVRRYFVEHARPRQLH